MSQAELLEEYERTRAGLLDRGEAIRNELAAALHSTPGLKVHSVTLRLKGRESLAGKIKRPDRSYGSLWDITDLIGIRVIVYFEDEVDLVGKIIESQLRIDLARSTDKRRHDAGAFGYRSLHYVFQLGGEGQALPARACGEVQVRTVLEHAWAEIEHDLGYKGHEAMPGSVRHRLHRLAGLLELADQEFVTIRRDLEAYASELPKRIAAAREAVPLDALSLIPLLECDEVRELDKEIASLLGKELGEQPFFPEYLLRMLRTSGLLTVADARAGIERHRAAILSMVKPYFAFAWRTWRLSPDQMEKIYRGYSLFFLAHAELLHGGALAIDKVERLTRLYRELDYPEDERAAQEVAGKLFEAFRDVG
jgi:ppGpp synthetase/RelA/SpoT-type nucleotidyltranferase